MIAVGSVSSGGIPSHTEAALARLSAAGVPDPAFGPGGCRVMALGKPGAPRSASLLSMAATSAGGVVAAGSATVGDALGASGFLALRLDAEGRPDAAFGDAGIAFFPPVKGSDRARQVVVDHDRVLLIGACGADDDGGSLCVLRLRADGRADAAYGSGGWAKTSATLPVRADVSAALQSDGKLVLAASTPLASPVEFVVARLTADGRSDPTFGAAGHVTIAFDTPRGASSQARAVALQAGRAVVAGQVSGSGLPALVAARLDSDLMFAGGFD